jgi:hypothetical protein
MEKLKSLNSAVVWRFARTGSESAICRRGRGVGVFLLLAAVGGWGASVAGARPYYVSKTGSNADGRSWAGAWSELDQIHWELIQPGDTIFLDGGPGGMTYTSTLAVRMSARADSPITVCASGESGHAGRIVIFGGRDRPLVSGHATKYEYVTQGVRKHGVDFGSASYVVLDGQKWRGIAIHGHNDSGIKFSAGSHHVSVRNVEIYDNGWAYFNPQQRWWNSDGPGVGLTGSNQTFERVIIHDNGQDCFQSGGGISQLTVRNSWLYNGRTHLRSPSLSYNYTSHSDGIQIYNGGRQSDVLFEGCVVGPGLMQGTILGQSPSNGVSAVIDDVVIRNCLFLDASNCNIMGYPQTWSRNWRIENVTAFMTRTNLDGKATSNVFLAGSGHSIANSIFYGAALQLPPGTVVTGNVQFHTIGLNVGVTADPQFVNAPAYDSLPDLPTLIQSDFALKPGSPALGKGSAITSVVQLLADANLIPAAPAPDPSEAPVLEEKEKEKH